jgi:hypothetical protein
MLYTFSRKRVAVAPIVGILAAFGQRSYAMAPCIREADVKASAATIWKTCIADMKWEKWDEDVERIENIQGGLKEGGSFTFVMKDGPITKIPVLLCDVKENERFSYSGGVVGGLIKVWGSVQITQNEDKTSRIKYSFSLSGVLGSVSMWRNPVPVVHGTETGLANLVRLSEAAEAK